MNQLNYFLFHSFQIGFFRNSTWTGILWIGIFLIFPQKYTSGLECYECYYTPSNFIPIEFLKNDATCLNPKKFNISKRICPPQTTSCGKFRVNGSVQVGTGGSNFSYQFLVRNCTPHDISKAVNYAPGKCVDEPGPMLSWHQYDSFPVNPNLLVLWDVVLNKALFPFVNGPLLQESAFTTPANKLLVYVKVNRGTACFCNGGDNCNSVKGMNAGTSPETAAWTDDMVSEAVARKYGSRVMLILPALVLMTYFSI